MQAVLIASSPSQGPNSSSPILARGLENAHIAPPKRETTAEKVSFEHQSERSHPTRYLTLVSQQVQQETGVRSKSPTLEDEQARETSGRSSAELGRQPALQPQGPKSPQKPLCYGRASIQSWKCCCSAENSRQKQPLRPPPTSLSFNPCRMDAGNDVWERSPRVPGQLPEEKACFGRLPHTSSWLGLYSLRDTQRTAEPPSPASHRQHRDYHRLPATS